MKKLMLTFAAVLLCGAAFAQDAEGPHVAVTSEMALQFSRIGRSPVAESMGGAGLLSTTSFAWASFNNPAAIPFAQQKADIAVSYNTWKPSSSNYLNIGGSYNINDKVGITAGASLGMGKTMKVTDEYGMDNGIFRPTDYQANIGIAYRFIPWMSVGANVRYIGQKIFTGTRQGTFASDIYFMGSYKGIKATVGLDNLGGKVKDLAGSKWSIPSSLTFAAGYETTLWDVHGIEAEFRGDYYFVCDRAVVYNPFCFALGAGYSYKFITVRAGYHYGAESSLIPSFCSAGLTVRLSRLHIDAMYYIAKESNPLKNNLSFGLGYSF